MLVARGNLGEGETKQTKGEEKRDIKSILANVSVLTHVGNTCSGDGSRNIWQEVYGVARRLVGKKEEKT